MSACENIRNFFRRLFQKSSHTTEPCDERQSLNRNGFSSINVENINTESINLRSIMAYPIANWDFEYIKKAFLETVNPFGDDRDPKNYYQIIVTKTVTTEAEYEKALDCQELCIDWIINHKEEHLEHVIRNFGEAKKVELRNLAGENADRIMDVLKKILKDAVRSNNMKAFKYALANGADILRDSHKKESVFDEILKDSMEDFLNKGLIYAIRHKSFSNKKAAETLKLACNNNKGADILVKLLLYHFLPALSKLLPENAHKIISIIDDESLESFKVFCKNVENNPFLIFTYAFYNRLLDNDKLTQRNKREIIKLICRNNASNFEALQYYQLKLIAENQDHVQDILKSLNDDVIFILKNNIKFKENVAFRNNFKKFYETDNFIIQSNERIFVGLITCAIDYSNNEIVILILNKGFENLNRQANENENLIKINNIIERVETLNGEVYENITLLSYAVLKNNQEAAKKLIEHGANFMNEDSYFESNILYFEKHENILEDHLDNCIAQKKEPTTKSEKISMNLKDFVTTENGDQYNPNIFKNLLRFVENDTLQKYLKHPIIATLIFLKWNAFSPAFTLNCLAVWIFYITFIVYNLFMFNHIDGEIHSNWYMYHFYIIIIFLCVFVIREIFQLVAICVLNEGNESDNNKKQILVCKSSFQYKKKHRTALLLLSVILLICYDVCIFQIMGENYKIMSFVFVLLVEFVLICLIFLNKIIKFEVLKFHHIKKFLKSNIVDWLWLIAVILSLTNWTTDFSGRKVIACFAILLSTLELSVVMRSASVPSISNYIPILERVVKTYLKTSILFGIYLISFVFCFVILFKNEPDTASMLSKLINETSNTVQEHGIRNATNTVKEDENDNKFDSISYGLMKTFVMFLGEFDFDANTYNSSLELVIFFLFAYIMTLISLNLYHGLAVKDVQEVADFAEVKYSTFQIEMLWRYEQTLNNLKKFTYLSPTIINWFVNYNLKTEVFINNDGSVKISQMELHLPLKIFSEIKKKLKDKVEKVREKETLNFNKLEDKKKEKKPKTGVERMKEFYNEFEMKLKEAEKIIDIFTSHGTSYVKRPQIETSEAEEIKRILNVIKDVKLHLKTDDIMKLLKNRD